ncbi:hypothetical protein CHISP_3376 [Chitinispirillum alkaliphilum]|nr:hypothetical protein CHISP_3376 [Chitinispirillum alkaliphilum]
MCRFCDGLGVFSKVFCDFGVEFFGGFALQYMIKQSVKLLSFNPGFSGKLSDILTRSNLLQ